MSNDVCHIAAEGSWGTVEWAVDSRGDLPARKVYLSLHDKHKVKIDALFRRLADFGPLSNREKFRQLGEKAGTKARGLWEFKSFQIRFIGDFKPGGRFIVAHGLDNKKRDNLPKPDIEKAVRILEEHDSRERGMK